MFALSLKRPELSRAETTANCFRRRQIAGIKVAAVCSSRHHIRIGLGLSLTEKEREMVLTLPPFFPRDETETVRSNPFALKCLLTVANERSEADLAKHDKNHVCDPSIPGPVGF
jgi:hypothetical protein